MLVHQVVICVFFIETGLALGDISKLNSHGKKVESWEIMATYQWTPTNVIGRNRFNYINFTAGHDDDGNALDVQITLAFMRFP